MRDPEQIRQACARKLRTVASSDHHQAILGCLLGEHFAERQPSQPSDLSISADNEISGPCDDGGLFSAWVGPSEILLQNVRMIASACALDADETAYLLDKVAAIKRCVPE